MFELDKGQDVFAISDGTGETVERIIRSVLLQYEERNARVVRYKSVRSMEQVDYILDEAKKRGAFVIYTIVNEELRNKVKYLSTAKKVQIHDIFGPVFEKLTSFLGGDPSEKPGLLHAVNEDYYKRIEAIEFTVKHDDGKNPENLKKADIVLVGVSRTSKTPLSIYLSHKGNKVANIPLVKGVEPPEILFGIKQSKVVALTIKPDALVKIRRERMIRMGRDPTEDYCSINSVREEVEWAQRIYDRNKKWPVFDVTNKALEETAADIEKTVLNPFL